jgi:sugar phosphate isomerase/epimerase
MFNFGISTTITDDRDVFVALEIIGGSSFRFLEIRCEKGHFNYEDKGEIKKLKMMLKKKSLKGISLHPPLWVDIANSEEWTRIKSLREVEKVVLVANRLNVPRIILHPGKSAGDIEKASESLSELISFAGEWGVEIILENTFPDDFGSSIDELKILSDKFDLPVCIDTSHASAKENILNRLLDLFEGRVKHFHLSDSMMKGSDDHLIPYEGKILWEGVVNFLNNNEGVAVFEVPHHNNPKIIEKLEEIKSRWENNKICP